MGSPATLSDSLDALGDTHLRRLLRASQEFNSTLELDSLLPRLLDMTVETLGGEAGSLWMLEDGELVCRVARGGAGEGIVGLAVPLGAGLVGDVARNRRPILIRDARSDDRFLHQVDELTGFETRSVVAAPLISRGEVLGVIQILNSLDGHDRDGADLPFLEALADDAAAALRNAKLLEAERRAHDLAALLEVSHEITSTFDLDRVLLSVVNLAGRAVRFERCVLALWEEERLRVRAISGEASVDGKAAAIRELEALLLWAAEHGGELHVPDTQDSEDERALQLRDRFGRYLEDSGVRGLLLLPLGDSEGETGVLLFEFGQPGRLGEWERKAAELLANEAALAIRNAQLYAGVPFISWLEPLAEKRRALAALPRAMLLRWAAAAVAVVLALALVRVPLRIGAADAGIRAEVQRPARAGIGGVIDAVFVSEGQRVRAGEPLARLRNEQLLDRLREAGTGLELAEREALAATGRGDAMAATLARIRAAQHADALRLLREEAARAQVVAPAAGVVLTPRFEELVGASVEAGAPVAWVGEPGWAEIEMAVAQRELGRIREGDRVRAKVSAHPAVIFEGRVTRIAPRADTLSGPEPRYTVRALLDNSQALLRPGMSARAKIITQPVPLAEFLFRRPWRWLRMRLWW